MLKTPLRSRALVLKMYAAAFAVLLFPLGRVTTPPSLASVHKLVRRSLSVIQAPVPACRGSAGIFLSEGFPSPPCQAWGYGDDRFELPSGQTLSRTFQRWKSDWQPIHLVCK